MTGTVARNGMKVLAKKIHGSRRFPLVLREFVLLLLLLSAMDLAGTAFAAPDKPFRIGVLTTSWGPTPHVVGLQQGLKELGYVENVDYVLGIRFTQGKTTELPRAVRDLLGSGVDLIYCVGGEAAKAAFDATRRVPIVFTSAADPVSNGLIKSYAHPGGNATGLADLDVELSARRLQLFHQIVPAMKMLLFVHDIGSQNETKIAGIYREAAETLGITLESKGVKTEAEARAVIMNASNNGFQGLIGTRRTHLNIAGFTIEAIAKHNIPTMIGTSFLVEQGFLASYGPSFIEAGRHSARLVDKIIKGANPGEIPVEVNTRLEFVINLKAAKKMGLKIDPEVLYMADRIIR